MAITSALPVVLSIRGRVVEKDPTTGLPVAVIYQRTQPALCNAVTIGGDPIQRRLDVPRTDPQTPWQLRNRARFALALPEWRAQTPEQKTAWRVAGKARRLSAYHAFLSAFMTANPPPQFSLWDAGGSTWDGGATVFDLT